MATDKIETQIHVYHASNINGSGWVARHGRDGEPRGPFFPTDEAALAEATTLAAEAKRFEGQLPRIVFHPCTD